jgi:carbamoyltransferase
MRTEMDCLVVGDFLMFKAEQPPFEETEDWRKQHTLD